MAAVLLLARQGGRPAVMTLLRSLGHWRVPLRWYLFALLCTPALMLLTIAISALHGGSTPESAQLAQWAEQFRARTGAFTPSIGLISGLVGFMSLGSWATAIGMVAIAVSQGGLSEEPGWRGYAMAQGLRRWNLLRTTLVVGCMWAAWHMAGPAHFQVLFDSGVVPFVGLVAGTLFEYLLLCIPLAILYALVFVGTGGSVLLAILLHASYNLTMTIVVSAWPDWAALTFLALLWVAAAAVFLAARHRFLGLGASRPAPN
jgi:membrane protease YdiL (CAAX protease family)